MWVVATAKYLVNLRSVGIKYNRETSASSPREAVHNTLYYYFGKNPSRLSLFVYRMKQELGEEGWDRKISEMADEIVEEKPVEQISLSPETNKEQYMTTEQLQLFEFQKSIEKDHPGAQIAANWKINHPMKFMSIDQVKETLEDADVTASVKIDGELVCLYYQNGVVETVTAKGTVRSGMPATQEAAELVKRQGVQQAAFIAELHAINEKGIPQSYMKSASLLKTPDGGQDHLIRLSVFDVAEIDGKSYEMNSIEDRVKVVKTFFDKGKNVHPAVTAHGDMTQVQKLWDQLEEQGWEGLVIYFGDIIYKAKPISSYDMVIVAVTKSDKFVDRVGAVMASFIDKEGRFRLNGQIGGGFNDDERIQLMEWAERNKVMEDDERIWVNPFTEPLIVEVEAMEVNIKKMPKMNFKDKKWVAIEDDWSGTLRFPQFKRFREDKKPDHADVPVEQLPITESSQPSHHRPYQDSADGIQVGMHVEVVTGYCGTVIGMMPKSGDGGDDLDILVEWDQPLFGMVPTSEIHPSEIVRIWE